MQWRGETEIPQLPGTCPCHGLVVTIDCWSGTGGLLVGLLAMGIRTVAVCIEQDAELRQAKAKILANSIQLAQVEEFRGEMVTDIVARRTVAAIILGGGAPCQANSSLNQNRRGLGMSAAGSHWSYRGSSKGDQRQ